jgi:uncharacterized MAPEG superfamily protein
MTGFTAVLLYIVWTLLLALSYAFYRVPIALSGRKPMDHWERGKSSDDPGILQRAKSAHLNCLENFPLFLAVVAIAALMQKSAVVDAVAAYILYARIGQSVVHLIGTSFILILLRATLFLTQVGLIFYIVWKLLGM